ncbi:hypothetical protein M0657_009477 [Pyricularia oryzae]|uniref:Uncharacterized protein n=1 Tax=Pyricularia oryzae TaxID=318829 RepID=A0A4P7MWL0_PYROR|nr:hypothetical protein M0657_009477 [Pyricularia oryzae]KAI7920366.1 hypothetical protein M9X92_005907 [Pyricularia oryzae]QBZ54468.1 hypothetical protein PoMZ_10168 [Pyricularia oryzae]
MNQGKPCSSFRGQQDCTPPDRAPVPTLAFVRSSDCHMDSRHFKFHSVTYEVVASLF